MGLEIKVYGNPILWKKSKKVEQIDDTIKSLINGMIKIMYENKGVGLSAPQVGELKRIIVVDIGEGLTVLVNPRILFKAGNQIGSEGCLSLPGIYLDIKRAQDVVVEGLDRNGIYVQIGASGLFARTIQHEIDHLDGILITEQIPKKRLKVIKLELEKIKKA